VGRIAVFIDAAYLQYTLKEEFARAPINFDALVAEIAGDRELLRAYYYDCLPYQSSRPTQEERERFGKAQGFHDALRRINRFEVRLGVLEFRGTKNNGAPIFQQKRVDILMGVDLVQLATKHQITDAAIVAGDSDFLPAIEVAKPEGVVVHLYHGQYPHHDLRAECDETTRITQEFIDRIRRD